MLVMETDVNAYHCVWKQKFRESELREEQAKN